MKINVKEIKNDILKQNEVVITIEHRTDNNMKELKTYIEDYEKQTVVVRKDNELMQIELKDIILFYSDKKNIFCKTKDKEYKVKNTLYEIETRNIDFVRISRSCIVNMQHLQSFDIGKTGTIVIYLDDGSKEMVSRRKIKDIMKYIEERSL